MAPFFMLVTAAWAMQFPLGDGFSYEPTREESIFGFAQAAGKDSAEYAYDQLMTDDGNGMIYLPILNYMDGNLDFTKELLQREDIVASLSDGGAHCGTICDAASADIPAELLGARPQGGDDTAGTGGKAPMP